MSIIQIIFLIVLAALVVFGIIKIIGMIRTDYDKHRAKYEEESQGLRFIAIEIALAFILFLAVQSVIIGIAATWEGLVTAWTPPKETRIVGLNPILDDDIFVFMDEGHFYFFADEKTRRDNNPSINYDASREPYAEAYKSREKIYLAIDKDKKWPIITISTETRYLLHLNNIDQTKKLNTPDLVSWD